MQSSETNNLTKVTPMAKVCKHIVNTMVPRMISYQSLPLNCFNFCSSPYVAAIYVAALAF